MAAQRQKVRLHFLIALTLAMLAFGASRIVRTYKREQVRTQYAETERELHTYAAQLLMAEHKQLENMAMAEPGRIGSDAAALLMQVRYYQSQQSSARGRVADASATDTTKILTDIRENFNRLRAGEPAVFPKGQAFLRAYYSAVDGTFQPYTLCLPKSYTGERPYPLIIVLHGRMGFQPFQCLGAPYYEGAIAVQPEGRGATDFMYIGEDDVLDVLEEVCTLYSVDTSRVYLVGTSMGATGCWNLAVHYPHLFAGIVPISGNADYRAWEQRWGWNVAPSQSHEWLRSFLHASLSPASYAENLQYCHIAAVHGTGDEVVPVEHARGMASRLRELGYAFEYLEFPQAGHAGIPTWAKDYAMAKVMGQPPASTPARFTYKTADPRHDRAWWLRLDRLSDPVRFATASAEASDGRVGISTENVSALTVLLNDVPGGVQLVSVDGAEFELAKQQAGPELRLEKWDRAWRRAEAGGVLKRKALSGPFSDVFRDPFMLVYGTAGESDLAKEISRQEAQRLADDWALRYGEPPRMKADSEVDANDIGSCSLLIFGGPDVNKVAAEIAAKLPASVSDVVTVGDRTYSGNDVGLMICYPNPLNPERMIAMVAGTTPAALYQAYERTGLWFDWGVYDEYKWFDYAVYDNRTVGPETFRLAGFFDNQWQLAPGGSPAGGGAAWVGDPAAVEGILPQGFPRYRSAAEVSGGRAMLSEVRPTAIDQYRGAVGFDRSYEGRAIEIGGDTFDRGLGVKVPSAVSFALGGQFRHFSATVGLVRGEAQALSPARIAAEGVVFEVWGDGALIAASPTLSWSEADRNRTAIEAGVAGVNVLTLKARPMSGATWLYGDCAWGAPTLAR